LEKLVRPTKVDLLSWDDLKTSYSEPPQSLIDDFLRKGDVLGLIGATKMRKTWFITSLAVHLAAGRKWLGFSVPRKLKILVIDNELNPHDVRWRYAALAKALNVDEQTLQEQITFMPLRGKLINLTELPMVLAEIEPDTYDVVILDSLYKFFPPKFQENDNGAMTQLLVRIDEIAHALSAAVIFTHHQSKGRQDRKAVTDVGSGAGALSRSPDLHMIIRASKVPEVFVVNVAARSQKPIDEFAIEWKYPLFSLFETVPELACDDKVQVTVDQVVNQVPEQPTNLKELIKQIANLFGCYQKQVEEILEIATREGTLVQPKRGNKKQQIYRVVSPAVEIPCEGTAPSEVPSGDFATSA
jgi:hypothetical protein